MKQMFTMTQTAQELNIHLSTLWRWEKAKKVAQAKRHLRTNRRIYTASDIERLKQYRDALIEPNEIKSTDQNVETEEGYISLARADNDIGPQIDVAGAKVVQVQASSDGKTVWVNVDGICRLRITRIEKLEVDYL